MNFVQKETPMTKYMLLLLLFAAASPVFAETDRDTSDWSDFKTQPDIEEKEVSPEKKVPTEEKPFTAEIRRGKHVKNENHSGRKLSVRGIHRADY